MLKPPRNFELKRLSAAIPTIVVVVLIEIAMRNGATFPFPFLFLFLAVVFAGSFGGFYAGFLAGAVSAWQFYQVYNLGVTDLPLAAGSVQAILGPVVFTFIGAQLGWLEDKNAAIIEKLQATEQSLQQTVEQKSSERDQQAAIVSELEEQLRSAMRLSGVGFFKWNAKTGFCEFCSEQHAAHFGLTPQDYQRLTSGIDPYVGFVHQDDRQTFLDSVARIDQGEALPFDYRVIRPNGDIRYIRQINEPLFDENGVAISVVGGSIDFTESHNAQERLRKSQRIDAIGNLTGGVAHDFNNLLAVILGNLELSQDTDDLKERDNFTQSAIDATHRGANLVKSMLSFAGRAHLTPTPVSLNHLLNSTIFWSSRVLPKNISIETSLSEELWMTKLDSASTESAILNLLLNARDAMPDGGKLTIKTENLEIEASTKNKGHGDIEPGHYVLVSISDTGLGIAPEKLQQIFEPFYTDKPVGQGTGLGLSMVQGFMKQSNGEIKVESKMGQGTTFRLYFQASSTEETAGDAKGDTWPASDLPTGLRILIAEDDESVARVLKDGLESEGHIVSLAVNGDEALKTYTASGPFDLLLTDSVMPGTLQGHALLKAIRRIEPGIPCIILSGYAADTAEENEETQPWNVRLMKPVSRDRLLAAIAQAQVNALLNEGKIH